METTYLFVFYLGHRGHRSDFKCLSKNDNKIIVSRESGNTCNFVWPNYIFDN